MLTFGPPTLLCCLRHAWPVLKTRGLFHMSISVCGWTLIIHAVVLSETCRNYAQDTRPYYCVDTDL